MKALLLVPAFEPLAINLDDPVAYLSNFDDEISVIKIEDSYAPNAAISFQQTVCRNSGRMMKIEIKI